MQRLIILGIGYLFGSLQTAIIIGRLKGLDIRSHGSGNAGATNTLRVLGLKYALLVFVGDMLKALMAIVIARLIFNNNPQLPDLLIAVYAGFGAILGHNWPVYFQFKGGKGIAVSMATLLMIDYRIGVVAAILFLSTIAFTRYVSLGSILLTLSAPIMLTLLHKNDLVFFEVIILITIIPVLAIYQHRANIGRLFKGTESKLGQKTK
ncbi:MAG TPA: glycerol-3-phosphate 1-O-acyltransferase PlsY [Epulopiscium sp.]|nr:glycerol-3-phosphate 1-O-acyltransferase PlsY [Candidatus Epulonipiscium sp.]